jgi:hypothetical protein
MFYRKRKMLSLGVKPISAKDKNSEDLKSDNVWPIKTFTWPTAMLFKVYFRLILKAFFKFKFQDFPL